MQAMWVESALEVFGTLEGDDNVQETGLFGVLLASGACKALRAGAPCSC